MYQPLARTRFTLAANSPASAVVCRSKSFRATGFGGLVRIDSTLSPGRTRWPAPPLLTPAPDTEMDEREAQIRAWNVSQRLPATHPANAPLRSRLCLDYGVLQEFLGRRVFT